MANPFRQDKPEWLHLHSPAEDNKVFPVTNSKRCYRQVSAFNDMSGDGYVPPAWRGGVRMFRQSMFWSQRPKHAGQRSPQPATR